MNELILDTSDPSVSEMISSWKEGGKYTISLNVTEGPTVGSKAHFAVDEVTDYGYSEGPSDTSDTGEPDESEPAPSKKKKNPALDKLPMKASTPSSPPSVM